MTKKETPDTRPGPGTADKNPSPIIMIDVLPFKIGVAERQLRGPYDFSEVIETDREDTRTA